MCLYVRTLYSKHSANKKTCSGITHTSQAGTHNTPKPKPPSILPINTSRIISYNTLTMTFVTTFNCNTVDNIYVKNM